ncbi:uncharacterized protein CIMG_13685 [Coccidioides immitis RS]|uniref:Uncharacterized protein n=1 Tax=Coccidioides immitis (strain RS) TaxID=246410 RepID=A0A0D8JWE0_COCIM|nr:uncharacterized protein CIMG_13685 [Coccidioides immitis RS]KJF61459.1 hypothetical protein CIMG_13685 [Coccidioides immitis RS]
MDEAVPDRLSNWWAGLQPATSGGNIPKTCSSKLRRTASDPESEQGGAPGPHGAVAAEPTAAGADQNSPFELLELFDAGESGASSLSVSKSSDNPPGCRLVLVTIFISEVSRHGVGTKPARMGTKTVGNFPSKSRNSPRKLSTQTQNAPEAGQAGPCTRVPVSNPPTRSFWVKLLQQIKDDLPQKKSWRPNSG